MHSILPLLNKGDLLVAVTGWEDYYLVKKKKKKIINIQHLSELCDCEK